MFFSFGFWLCTAVNNVYYGIVKNVASVNVDFRFVKHDCFNLAIVENGTKNLPFYQHRMIAASEFTEFDDILQATFLYNGLAIHSAPISLNLITNTLVKHLLGKDYEISASIHPFQSVGPTTPEPLSTTQIGLLWIIILPLGFLFFLGSFIYFPHKEISSNFIQLQYISGMTPWFYWIFAFISDYIIYLVAVTILSTLILLWTPFRGIKEWRMFLQNSVTTCSLKLFDFQKLSTYFYYCME